MEPNRKAHHGARQTQFIEERHKTRSVAEAVVLETENKESFFAMVDELLEEHQPKTPTEEMPVKTIASATWRRDRIWNFQKTQFDKDIKSHAQLSPPEAAIQSLQNLDTARTHELLLRYEVALDREISRALLRLTQLKSHVVQTGSLRPIGNRPTQTKPSSEFDPNASQSAAVVQARNVVQTGHVGQSGTLQPIGNRPTQTKPPHLIGLR
jgi:hypothetical protein